jgi:hypothetical protein
MTAYKRLFVLCMAMAAFLTMPISGQTGGPFAITQSTISSGVESSNGSTAVASTSGQAAAGGAMRGGPFTVTSGFWNFSPLAPTAAMTSVGGRVLTADGRGIRNAILTLSSVEGMISVAASGSLGYFEFPDVIVGRTYTLEVSSKRFTFGQPMISVTVVDQVTDLNFVADPLP